MDKNNKDIAPVVKLYFCFDLNFCLGVFSWQAKQITPIIRTCCFGI